MRIGSILLCLFFGITGKGQPLLFENYSSEQGLSQNSCYTIAQDAEGFMWLGTQDGLNRFDGKQFRIFLPKNDIGKNLPSNYISSLFFDKKKNQLWVGTIAGACIYVPERDSLVKITSLYPFATQLENVSIKKIISFNDDEYWIITFNRGLLLLNTQLKTLTTFFNDEANRTKVNSLLLFKNKLIVASLQRLFYLEPGKTTSDYQVKTLLDGKVFPEIRELFSYHDDLWIGTLVSGCYLINNPFDSLCPVRTFGNNTWGIGCFSVDANDNLWIGTRGNGIIQYNDARPLLQTAEHNPYDNRSPGKNFVLSLFSDRQGLMWCGLSGSGLAKYDPLKYQFTTISNDPVNPLSLPDNMVFDIFKCADGVYYVGTQNKGLAKWEPEKNQFIPYAESSKFGSINNTIYDMDEDTRGNLWIASWGGLLQLERKNNQLHFNEEKNLLTAKKLYSIIKLKSSDSLFITGENGPVFFSLKDKQWRSCPENIMQANAYIGRYIYEDAQHVIWICTVGAGLIRYDYRVGHFEIIESVSKYSVYSRHLLPIGSQFWLATDNGIIVYDYLRKEVIKHVLLNTSSGSNVCYAIQQDQSGYFWVSTNTGLYRIHPKNYAIQNYDWGNGLSFLEYNTACTLKETDGTLLFGGVGGFTRFNPSQLKANAFSPDPVITSINIYDQPYSLGKAISQEKKLFFNYNENFITIYFAMTNFSNPLRNQFSYRLKGLSNNWTDCGNRNFANYTSLPPGDYTFQLKAANSDGKWSPGITELVFTIFPPWWQTWWFTLGSILAVAALITWLVRRRIAAIRHASEMKSRIAETEMMALRAQMNPHFIFNCINSIDALIQSNDKYQATVYLNKFAKLIRNILDSSKQNSVPLSKDIDTLKLYIELEQLRNENKFTAAIHTDEDLLVGDYKVPPLIIQPYVENAILHGLRKRPDNLGKLTVSIRRQNNHLEYIVEDNGVGRKATNNSLHKEKQSYGLQITNDRVKLFNEEEIASVDIQDLHENGRASGTRIIIQLKLK